PRHPGPGAAAHRRWTPRVGGRPPDCPRLPDHGVVGVGAPSTDPPAGPGNPLFPTRRLEGRLGFPTRRLEGRLGFPTRRLEWRLGFPTRRLEGRLGFPTRRLEGR